MSRVERRILLIFVAVFAVLISGGACSESNEEWINARVGLKDGVCKDGDFQYWPPECVPDEVSSATNGEMAP